MPPPPTEPRRDSFAGTVVIASGMIIALLAVAAFAYALFGPAIVVVLILAVGFGAFGVLHWFLWGSAMSRDPDE